MITSPPGQSAHSNWYRVHTIPGGPFFKSRPIKSREHVTVQFRRRAFFQAIDRTMSDNFFRPGFTQGAWANGEVLPNLHYLAFVGNGLNTLNISATRSIRTCFFPAACGGNRWDPTDTRQIHEHVRRLFLLQANSHSNRHFVYEISRGPFLKPRSIESGEHFTLQFRRRADLRDRSVCAGCHGRRGHVQDVGDRLGPQMERACGQRAVLHAVAG